MGVTVGVLVGVPVSVGVGVMVGVPVLVGVGVLVGVPVLVGVGVAVLVGVGVMVAGSGKGVRVNVGCTARVSRTMGEVTTTSGEESSAGLWANTCGLT